LKSCPRRLSWRICKWACSCKILPRLWTIQKSERAGIFLTNALTGWNFTGENAKLAQWPELEAERKGAGNVKQEKPILVILGIRHTTPMPASARKKSKAWLNPTREFMRLM